MSEIRAMIEVAGAMKHRALLVRGRRPRLLPGISGPQVRKALDALELILQHGSMGRCMHRALASHEIVIASGFMTQLLPIVWLFSRGSTRRALLLVHHNVQEARHRPALRRLLGLGCRLGYRFLVFENADGIADLDFGHSSRDRFIAIPRPLTALATPRSPPPHRPVVGLIGHFRPEKGQDRLLERLLSIHRAAGGAFEILVGSSRLDAYPPGGLASLRTVDTSSDEAYVSALRSSDIVIIGGEPDRYLYRTSGIIADAVRAGCLVVCPDYPVFRQQVQWPEPVGEVYQGEDDLDRALMAAVNRARAVGQEPFHHHLEARHPRAVAAIIDDAVAGRAARPSAPGAASSAASPAQPAPLQAPP